MTSSVISYHLCILVISLTDQIANLFIKKLPEIFNRGLIQLSVLSCRDISMPKATYLVKIKLFPQDKPHTVKQDKYIEQTKTFLQDNLI